VLRGNYILQPHQTRLRPTHPYFLAIMDAHQLAVNAGLAVYRDPVSGLAVFTAAILAQRDFCCTSGCRHCPYVGSE
jgi:hypothetical protein